MKIYLAVLIFVSIGAQLSNQISLPSSPTYRAGVVEFKVSKEIDERDRLMENLKHFLEIIESEETKNLDILVFPEGSLNTIKYTTYVPSPDAKIVPCTSTDYDYFLAEISCGARARKLYLVVNIYEKVKGRQIYNTNVVFDRNGAVISRYRKTNLYNKEWDTVYTTLKPEFGIFTTDFNVTFAHFTSFDLLFYQPAQKIVKELNITDIIYPTMWHSELPFLTALQIQESWAYVNNVNLLAANINNPRKHQSGSGIFGGKAGRLSIFVSEDPATKLLTANVRKWVRKQKFDANSKVLPDFSLQLEGERFKNLSVLRDFNIDIFETKLLEYNFTKINQKVCHNKFCCEFDLNRTLIAESVDHTAYRYRVVAYSGKDTTFQRVDRSVLSVCAVIACLNDELISCGRIFPQTTLVGNKYFFNSLTINGIFTEYANELILPSTVDSMMMPLPIDTYEMYMTKYSNKTSKVELKLVASKADLLTFGIWSNHYISAKSKHNLDKYFVGNFIANNSDKISSKQNAFFAIIIFTLGYLWY